MVPDPFFPRYEEAATLLEAFEGSPLMIARACSADPAVQVPVPPSASHVALDAELCAFAGASAGSRLKSPYRVRLQVRP